MASTKTSTKWWPLVLLMVAVIVIWLLWWWIFYHDPDRGTFGDMFGGVNTLFSGLAFAGVIYAIFLQRKELELQREELVQTREELKGQKLMLKAQNETLRKQNFEDTFFQLLRLFSDNVRTIDLKDIYQGLRNSEVSHYNASTHDLQRLTALYEKFFARY